MYIDVGGNGVYHVLGSFILTLERVFSGAMLDRSQYAPSSRSDSSVSAGVGGDVCVDVAEGADASLMLWMIFWTSASVGGAESPCPRGSGG